MRTTIDLEYDVLTAAKELATREGVSLGNMISRLLRQGLQHPVKQQTSSPSSAVAGFIPFPANGAIITDRQINAIRDTEGV